MRLSSWTSSWQTQPCDSLVSLTRFCVSSCARDSSLLCRYNLTVIVLQLYYNIGCETVQIAHKQGAVTANIHWALQSEEVAEMNAQNTAAAATREAPLWCPKLT